MKKVFVIVIWAILYCSCKTNSFSNAYGIQTIYVKILPYIVSPRSINEVNIHFIEENTGLDFRIDNRSDEIIAILKNLKSTKKVRHPNVWIGLQLANEYKRMSIGILKNGVIKIGNHFYEKDDLLLSIIFQQKIHPRILETIPRDSIWGRFLPNK